MRQAQWIWIRDNGPDTYADFTADFTYSGGRAEVALSCDGDFALWVNGVFVRSGQYPDFPHYKAVERIDIAPWCRNGGNTALFTVWHCGMPHTSTYYPAEAGFWCEITCEGETAVVSTPAMRSRPAKGYRAGRCRLITGQMGLSFHYDATDEGAPWGESVAVDKEVRFVERPVPPCEVGAPVWGQPIAVMPDRVLFDLGRETVGLPTLHIVSPVEQEITVTWGEHIVDGEVRRRIGSRDFSFVYTARAGENLYTNPFRRLGARYLEVYCDTPLSACEVGLCPVEYPVKVRRFVADSAQRQRIYDTAVHTLRCCMHDHYEDCPWREQALYAMDSRNQMLCGYYAFAEYDFAVANLGLMAASVRSDGSLPICAPAGSPRSIPSFQLIYAVAVSEYERYSGRCVPEAVWRAARDSVLLYAGRLEADGLLHAQPYPCWNFYEWTDGSDHGNELGDTAGRSRTDTLLNLFFLLAAEEVQGCAETHGEVIDLPIVAVREALRRCMRREDGALRLSDEQEEASALTQSLAILTGVFTPDEARAMAHRLTRQDNGLVPVSLSMRIFLYEALLCVDERYCDFVLDDLDRTYGAMLSQGATTFWETLEGQRDFDNAGSLCHGWSALPVYYYARLGAGRYEEG